MLSDTSLDRTGADSFVVCVSVSVSVCMHVCLSIYLSLSACLSVCLSVCLSICLLSLGVCIWSWLLFLLYL